jgi:hypothetical protein
MTRRGVLVLVLGVLLAACTTEQSSNPGPTLTSTTSTTTIAPATTTTTTVAPTTVAAATSAPETTTGPSAPVDAVVPLLIGGDEGGWLSLGAWQFDRWSDPVDAEGAPVPPSIGPGTAVTVSNLGPSATGQLGESTEACFDGRIGPTVDVTVPVPDPPGFGYGAVALPTPSWDLTPRPLAVTARGPAAYGAIGVDSFTGEPVDASLGSVDQLVVTDLDGDGDDEALVVFEYVQADSIRGAPGDLASVLLVDASTRESSTVLQSFVDQDLGANALPLLERFRILDVADYNGDATMEVAVHAWYYEGSSVIVFEYDGTELTEVLAAGCGA